MPQGFKLLEQKKYPILSSPDIPKIYYRKTIEVALDELGN
jgi:hypothetical protein